ncbi:hypothetical protein, partial [Proteus mirabilis]|uniref:hypothetical protein n=1 Tax=Proteus mirabilis TaxID=584 RepID=UPI001954FE58
LGMSSIALAMGSGRLPEGWVMFSNFENGVLKLALAGTTPLTDGDVALIGIALKDKEAAALE